MSIVQIAHRVNWIALALLLAGSSVTPRAAAQNSPAAAGGRTAVVVELFTSEGCSTCPPADDLLDDLVKHQPVPGVLVIGLGEHVDYWNQLGWTDRFSSGLYSQRQSVYARNMKASQVYTPQVVINGSREALGSDRKAVVHGITAAARETTGVLTISRTGGSRGAIQLTATLTGSSQGDEPELIAAVTDDEDVTMVAAGENGGHSLHYSGTARSLRSYGPITNGQPKALEIQIPPDSAKKKMHVVVFAQLPNQGRIVAAASTAI